MIADNRLTEISTWDDHLLGQNLKVLSDLDLDFDLECIGFDYGEIEQRVLAFESADTGDDDDDGSDDAPSLAEVPAVSRLGDLWRLGEGRNAHRVLCGDCTTFEAYETLLVDAKAAMVFTDPPYNLPARDIGQVCAGVHGDFAMASGEMKPEEFTAFLGRGSGSTLIGCEKTQRRCMGIELSPRYVDVAIRRWEQWTDMEAVHGESGLTFAELAATRESEDQHG